MTTHNQSAHFNVSPETHALRNAREDQIRRLLRDIGFASNNTATPSQETVHDTA